MSDQQPTQPRAEWVFPPERNRKGRAALIVILVLVVVLIAALLVFFMIPKGSPGPDPSSSPSATSTPTRTPSPTPSASRSPTTAPSPAPTTPAPTPDPTVPPTEQPPPPDPDVETFRGSVAPRLDDAVNGLDMVTGTTGQEALEVVDQLQQDAQILNDTPAPSSLAESWPAALGDYAARLADLRGAAEAGSDTQPALDAAKGALGSLRALIGL
ncbi:hypothetical protein PFZ55_42760 [Streptomyces sp. MS2A]|nr:hypothetical protein [Streptomyces sp. MS2A]